MIKGIDISRWQGIINWPIVARNVQFAMIKLGGSDEGFYQDGQAVRNALESRAAGIPVGFYVYLGGVGSVADEVNHIKNLINNIGGLREGEPIALDWEEHNPNEVQYVAGVARGLIDAGISAPLIYMSLSRVRGADWSPLVSMNCGLWVAAWGNNDDVADAAPASDEWPVWALWQFSSVGTVPGISGRVDLDLFQGDVNQFKKYGGTRNVIMPSPVNTSKVVPPVGTSEYTVVKDDNLSVIAARFGKSWQELWNLNRDRVSNPNKIFPGLKLRVWETAAPAAPAPQSTDTRRRHTVENGENLSVIAAKYGVGSWTLLWEANKAQVPNPDLIRPGQVLIIP